MNNLTDCAAQSELAIGPIFRRRINLALKGDMVIAHAHLFDHVTFFFRGQVAVHTKTVDGVEADFVFGPGDEWLIEATTEHSMTALEDDCLIACVFVHHNEAGEIKETYQGLRATQ